MPHSTTWHLNLKVVSLWSIHTYYFFQMILRHENSELHIAQLCVQFTQVLSAFQPRAMLQHFRDTDWKWCWVLPEVLCLSQLVDTLWLVQILCSYLKFIWSNNRWWDTLRHAMAGISNVSSFIQNISSVMTLKIRLL